MNEIFLALGLTAIAVSIYGYRFSPRTKGKRVILFPGHMGLAVTMLYGLGLFLPEQYRTGLVPMLMWVGLGVPLAVAWGYFVIRELLNLKKEL